MLHRLSEMIADYFFDDKEQYSTDIYVYGIELAISSIIGTLLIIVLGIVTGYLTECVIFMITLTSIRIFSGGYHADTYLKCNVITLISIMFSLITSIVMKIFFAKQMVLLSLISIFVLLVLTIVICCPIENKNKPIQQEDRNKYKWLSLTIVIIQASVCFIFYYIYGFDQVLIVIPTMFVVNLSIFAEIILKQRREKYERKEKHKKGC